MSTERIVELAQEIVSIAQGEDVVVPAPEPPPVLIDPSVYDLDGFSFETKYGYCVRHKDVDQLLGELALSEDEIDVQVAETTADHFCLYPEGGTVDQKVDWSKQYNRNPLFLGGKGFGTYRTEEGADHSVAVPYNGTSMEFVRAIRETVAADYIMLIQARIDRKKADRQWAEDHPGGRRP